jgi:hypothetical protein
VSNKFCARRCTTQFWASWRVKFNDIRYAIGWEVTNTSSESYQLVYLADGYQACSAEYDYIICGIDSRTHDGNWWTMARNLTADLSTAGKGTIQSVDALHIWTLGNGLADDFALGADAPAGWVDADGDGIADANDNYDNSASIGPVYEDAEDGSTARWWIVDDTPTGASIANVDDTDSSSKAIEFTSTGQLNAFELRQPDGTQLNSTNFNVSIEVKFASAFELEIWVKTNEGRRIIQLNSRDDAAADCTADVTYIICGLDSSLHDGTWKTLSGDLAVFVSQVTGLTLQAVQSIIVRGSGRVDNVTLSP